MAPNEHRTYVQQDMGILQDKEHFEKFQRLSYNSHTSSVYSGAIHIRIRLLSAVRRCD